MTHTAFIWGLIPYLSSIHRHRHSSHFHFISSFMSSVLFIKSHTSLENKNHSNMYYYIISPISPFINGQLFELKKLLARLKKKTDNALEERLTRYI